MGHKKCCVEDCTKFAQRDNVCIKHGAKVNRKPCSAKNCTAIAQKNSLCCRHGGK